MSPAQKLTKAFLSRLRLIAGNGPDPGPDAKPEEIQACVMNLVAWAAGEAWTDHPKCASPVLTEFCIRLNDRWSDEERQQLVPFIPRLINSKGDKQLEELRAWMAADWAIRKITPIWLRAAGLDDDARALEELPEIRSAAAATTARNLTRSVRERTWAKRSEAYDAWRKVFLPRFEKAFKAELEKRGLSADIAASAASAASADIAAIADIADIAAIADKRQAVWDAVYYRLRDSLRPKIEAQLIKLGFGVEIRQEVQKSALELLDRMIDAKVEAPV